MAKSSELLIDRLEAAISSGRLTKAEVKRRTKFSSSLLETYLRKSSVPGLEAAERIAAALETPLHVLLDPNPGKPHEHDLAECLRRVSSAVLGSHILPPASSAPATVPARPANVSTAKERVFEIVCRLNETQATLVLGDLIAAYPDLVDDTEVEDPTA